MCLSIARLVLRAEGWSPAGASSGVELEHGPSRGVALNKVVWQLPKEKPSQASV